MRNTATRHFSNPRKTEAERFCSRGAELSDARGHGGDLEKKPEHVMLRLAFNMSFTLHRASKRTECYLAT